jgi:phosphate transport system substrate-binding protein
MVMAGDPVIAERLMPALIEAFSQQRGYYLTQSGADRHAVTLELRESTSDRAAAEIEIHSSSSDEGFADLLAEEADIVLSSRALNPEELALAKDAGFGSLSTPSRNRVIALDALVPVVSPRNGIQEISPEDLAGVFSGRISNWRDFGGVDAPIELHMRQPGAGAMAVFKNRIMDPASAEFAENISRHETDRALVDAVSRNPFAIGLTSLSELGNARPVALTGGCGFNANATPEALKSDDYPLTAPMFLYLRPGRLPAVGREVLRFLDSPAAQIAILRAGFVDQAFSRTPVNRQGNRLANAIRSAGDEVSLADLQRLVAAMDGARRLSVTFRFDGGSTDLNAQSRSNIALLARALETGTLGAKELVFVGFSDGQGPADANQKLSRQRAASVRNAVRAEATTADLSRVRLRVEGFGEAMPMACDENEWGRQINRRVEVWVR